MNVKVVCTMDINEADGPVSKGNHWVAGDNRMVGMWSLYSRGGRRRRRGIVCGEVAHEAYVIELA